MSMDAKPKRDGNAIGVGAADSTDEGTFRTLRANLSSRPNAARAVKRYRNLAVAYDESCGLIEGIRARAVAALGLRPGEVVCDVACGTGATLVALAQAVGEGGQVIGLELSDDMATLAHKRIESAGLTDRCRVRVGAIEEYLDRNRYDAFLFCYTHDVLQSPQALAALFAHARDGARFLPWWWGFPLNLVTAYRGRRYLTTFRGLRRPWHLLENYCPDFRVIGSDHAGTSYLGVGTYQTYPGKSNHSVST